MSEWNTTVDAKRVGLAIAVARKLNRVFVREKRLVTLFFDNVQVAFEARRVEDIGGVCAVARVREDLQFRGSVPVSILGRGGDRCGFDGGGARFVC